jgi:hypothetical protein
VNIYPHYIDYIEMMTRIDYGYATLLLLGLSITLVLYRFGSWNKPSSRYLKALFFIVVTIITMRYSVIAGLLTFMLYLRSQNLKIQKIQLPMNFKDVHWLTGLALAMRLPRLFDNFWYDEAFTAAIAKLPAANLPQAILNDVHPPLWYGIEWLMARISIEEVFLRLPALLFGTVNVLLIYRLTLALGFNKKTARIAGILIAVLPAQLYYSNEARGYTLLTMLVLFSLIGLLQNRPLWFIFGTALLGWTHNIGYLYAVACIGTALLYHRNKHWLVASIASSLINALWLPFMIQQSNDIADGFWLHPLTLPGAFLPVADMTIGLRLDEQIVILAVVPVLVFTLISLWRIQRWYKTRNGMLWMVFTLGVPAALALVAAVWKPVYLTRALLPSATLLVISWAWLIANRPRTSKLPIYALFASMSAALIALFFTNGKQLVANYLDICASADSAYYTSIPARIIGQYYLPDLPQGIWPLANDLNQQLSPAAKTAFQFYPTEIHDLPGNKICYFQIETPLTSQAEISLRSDILKTYPHTSQSITPNNLATYNVYLLTRVP